MHPNVLGGIGAGAMAMADGEDGKVLVDKEVADLADHYIDFILSLGFLKQLLDQGADQQKICFEALRFTKQFVDWHSVALATGLSQPFSILAAGLNDVWAKRRPKIFKHNSKLKHETQPGETFNAVKAAAAAMLELRVYYKEEPEIAAREISREFNKFGVTRRGNDTPITWKTVKGWRDEMDGRNHPVATAMFKQITQDVKAHFGEDAELPRVKRLTGQFLIAAAHAGAFLPVKSEKDPSRSDF